MRPTETGFEKLSDAELSRRVGRYEIIERIGGWLVVLVFIGAFAQAIVRDNPNSGIPLAILLIFCDFVIMRLVPMRAERKKNALLVQQLGDYFYAELARLFGPGPEMPEMPINESFLKAADLLGVSWQYCDIADFHEGVHNGLRFSAANVKLSNKEVGEGEDSGIRTRAVFLGVVLRCKDICDPALDLALRDRFPINIPVRTNGSPNDPADLSRYYPVRKDGSLNDPAAFHRYYSARTLGGQSADDLVTPPLRELIRKLEAFAANGRVAALTFRNGELTLALNTSYAFSHIPEEQDLRDIDGIRKCYTDSLITMGRLIDLLRDSCGKI